nr:bifunctional phosphopantothenoylcysteine decarboxylase/phosphopantothenate--cysteine ligase CoaBC [Petrachloros mirabilis]
MSPRILVGLGGGIAAYKICEVISTLVKADYAVRAMLTDAAAQFITPLTVTTLCRHPAYDDAALWHPNHSRPLHIDLAEWAEVLVLAPLTANTLAKLAMGIADNLLTNTVLASHCPVLLVPAMNTIMWQQPTVQRNWQEVLGQGRFHALAPTAGRLACDTVGMGRLTEPHEIIAYVQSLALTHGKRDLAGKRLLISAGGTREFLDPVRFIGNPATGKMGRALARAAWHRGATVTLVHGPSEVPVDLPTAIEMRAVTSAQQMQAALLAAFPAADWTIMAAAVADVTPTQVFPQKLPKAALPAELPLTPVDDILKALGQHKHPQQRLIGFAAQTGDIVAPARQKLIAKQLDAIVANPVDQADSGFGCDRNQGVFIPAQGQPVPLPHSDKLTLAHRILDHVHLLPRL